MEAKWWGHPGGRSGCSGCRHWEPSQSQVSSSELIDFVRVDWPCECVGPQCELCPLCLLSGRTSCLLATLGFIWGMGVEGGDTPGSSLWMLWMCCTVDQQPPVRGLMRVFIHHAEPTGTCPSALPLLPCVFNLHICHFQLQRSVQTESFNVGMGLACFHCSCNIWVHSCGVKREDGCFRSKAKNRSRLKRCRRQPGSALISLPPLSDFRRIFNKAWESGKQVAELRFPHRA